MAKFFGNVFWRRTNFPEDKKSPSEEGLALDRVLDEDRESESLTPDEEYQPEPRKKREISAEWVAAVLQDDQKERPPVSREEAELIQYKNDRARSSPVALVDVFSHERSFSLFAEGLRQQYVECLLTGRLDAWAATAHAAIDLLASPYTKIVKRDDIAA